MALVMTAGPAVEPISLAEAKAHLRLDDPAEDTLVASLILTSRLHVETALGLALITQGWSYFLDRWPQAGEIALPMRPVSAIAGVRLYDANGAFTTLAPAAFTFDPSTHAPRLVRAAAAIWPQPQRSANGIEIAFTAGYGPTAAQVPEPIRHAVRLLVAHWYEFRAPVEIGGLAQPIPSMISELLGPYRPVRL